MSNWLRMVYLKSLTRNSLAFWRLAWSERLLLIQAVILLPVLALAVNIGGLRRTRVFLERLAPEPASEVSKEQIEQAATIARLVRIAARYNQPWTKCLSRSLALWWLLRRHSIASNLHIGVRREQGKFEAHAWVECQATILNDSSEVRDQFRAFNRPITGIYV